MIDNCIFVNTSSGTALIVEDCCTVHIKKSSFYNYYAKRSGSTLVALMRSFIIVDNCTINNSSACNNGGVAGVWESI